MDVLRESEVYPSFDEIGDLVLGHRTSRAVPFWMSAKSAVLEGVVVATVLVAGLSLTGRGPIADSHIAEANASLLQRQVGNTPPATYPSSARNVAHRAVMIPIFSGTQGTKATAGIIAMDNTAPIKESAAPADTLVSTLAAASTTEISNASSVSQLRAVFESPFVAMQEFASPGRWVVYSSGGYILSGSSAPVGGLMQSLAGSIGIRYQFSDASSLALEARRNVFHVRQSTQSTGLRDTTISLDGRTYTNTLGSASNSNSELTNLIGSINLGYRFELWPESNLSPFGQVFLGASTSGGLMSEIVGLRYSLNNQLLFDLSARTDQLVSSTSSPQRALGLEASVGFAW